MKCPKCDKEMILLKEDFSFDTRLKPKKKYLRKQYKCEIDDIWIKIETPAK